MSGKLTKYNLNKQRMEKIGEQKQEADDKMFMANAIHPYNQRFIIQESYEPKRFLWISYKSNIIKTVIPTGLCEVCGLPALAHE